MKRETSTESDGGEGKGGEEERKRGRRGDTVCKVMRSRGTHTHTIYIAGKKAVNLHAVELRLEGDCYYNYT